MKLKSVIVPAVLSLALGVVAAPAGAQQRGEEHAGNNGRERAAPRRGGGSQEAAPPQRQGQQRQAQPQQAPPPRQQAQPERGAEPQQARRAGPREGQRAASQRGIHEERNGEVARRSREHGDMPPRAVPYRPYYYARPYYTFRPRYNVGFGLWLGYAVPYPYYDYDADAYPPPDEYAPPPPNAIEVEPGEAYGGLSFDIAPDAASVYIDSEYAGPVADFTPNAQPLTVGAGRHRIEIDAPGYRPMVFDVDVEPGQVIPFQGAMEPY